MAAKSIREVLDGIQTQGINESILYSIDTLPWGGTPTSPTHDIFDEEDFETSLKSTLMPGTPTVSSNDIILPALNSLTARIIYRVTVKFASAGNTLEGYFRVRAE